MRIFRGPFQLSAQNTIYRLDVTQLLRHKCPSWPRFPTHGWQQPCQDDTAQPIKLDLNIKLDPKQKTIQAFNIDIQAKGSEKQEMKILPGK